MKKTAIIIGYSGHSYVALDAILGNEFDLIGYCEQSEKEHNPYQLKYLGNERENDVFDLLKKHTVYICIGDNVIRARVLEELIAQNIFCPVLIDKSAIVSVKSIIGVGTFVYPGAIINACARLGKGIICNSASIIEHDCEISDYCHIAPGAVLAGNVKVGMYSFIGANAVIKQGVRIGVSVIVGAGAVVIKDIPDGTIVYGNPAKYI